MRRQGRHRCRRVAIVATKACNAALRVQHRSGAFALCLSKIRLFVATACSGPRTRTFSAVGSQTRPRASDTHRGELFAGHRSDLSSPNFHGLPKPISDGVKPHLLVTTLADGLPPRLHLIECVSEACRFRHVTHVTRVTSMCYACNQKARLHLLQG